MRGGLFLLHFPDGYPWLTLSAILSCEARTFLTVIPFGNIPRDRLTELFTIIPHRHGFVKREEGKSAERTYMTICELHENELSVT